MTYTPILSVVEQAAMKGLTEAGREVLKRARELSPTLSGDSDKSGFVATDDLTVQVGFTSIVSMLQHERTEWQHPGGGQAKFLETAADEVDVERVIAEAVRSALGG